MCSVENVRPGIKQWKTALRLLRAIEELPEGSRERESRIHEARGFFLESRVEHLQKLARILQDGMDDKQLLCAIVPVERVAARQRVTDADMHLVSTDLPVPSADTFPLTIVADNLRSAMNIGGIFRTAEFFGADAVWLCGYTATPEHPHVAKSAMGAEQLVPWRTFPDVRYAIAELHAQGRAVYALETADNAQDVTHFQYQFPSALLLGNERFGLDPEVLSLSDAVVAIRSHGSKNSLNVVSAAAITLCAARSFISARR